MTFLLNKRNQHQQWRDASDSTSPPRLLFIIFLRCFFSIDCVHFWNGRQHFLFGFRIVNSVFFLSKLATLDLLVLRPSLNFPFFSLKTHRQMTFRLETLPGFTELSRIGRLPQWSLFPEFRSGIEMNWDLGHDGSERDCFFFFSKNRIG